MSKIHCLKTWPEYYQAIVDGRKTFELRKNDRDYQVSDVLVLQEFNPATGHPTLEMVSKKISYIAKDLPQWGLQPGFVILALENL